MAKCVPWYNEVMGIRKYLHSCICLENQGKRLLIDPGLFSFVEGKLSPERIGAVDAILLTHRHNDHYHPDALKAFAQMRKTRIVADEETGALLAKEGIKAETIGAGETKAVEGFTVKAFRAEHGPIPAELPLNLAYLVNENFLHPGDSFAVSAMEFRGTLALPIAGPWALLVEALAFAKKLKPARVIPVHDAIVKEFFLTRMYEICAKRLAESKIEFHPLGASGGPLTG